MTLRTLAVLADSMGEMSTDATYDYETVDSFPTYMVMYSGGMVHYDASLNFGVSSETIAQVGARTGAVITAAPNYCATLAGANDLINATTATSTEMADEYEEDIITPLVTANIEPIVFGVPPIGTLSNAMNQKRLEFNALLRDRFTYAPGAELIEAAASPNIVDAGLSYDNVHPSSRGYDLYGQAGAATLMAFQDHSPAFLTKLDSFAVTGTGGSLVNGATGGPATGWTLDAASVSDMTATGNELSGLIDASGQVDLYTSLVDLSSLGTGVAVGETINAEFDVEWRQDNLARITFELAFYTSGSGLIALTNNLCFGPQNSTNFPTVGYGKARVSGITVPATAAKCALFVRFVAGAGGVGKLRHFTLNGVALNSPDA